MHMLLLTVAVVRVDVPDDTTVSLSFADSENIAMVPPRADGSMEVTKTLPPYSGPTLICSVKQDDRMEAARVGMSMDISFSTPSA